MKNTSDVLYGAVIGCLSLGGCASVSYHFYGISLPDSCYPQGQLLGKTGGDGWPDLPMTECRPDAIKGKCVVELEADHFAKETALDQCQAALKTCQGGTP